MLRKLLILGLLILFVVGVGRALSFWLEQQSKPALEYVAIGIDETRSPVVLGIQVKNNTNSAITIIDGYTNLTWEYFVFGNFTPENVPERLEYETTLLGKKSVDIPANSTAVVNLELNWLLDKSAPPSVAACETIPALRTVDSTLVTESVAFVVTHKGNDESIQNTGGFKIKATQESARKFLQSTSSIHGKKSKQLQKLIDGMSAKIQSSSEESIIPYF